MWQNWFRLRIPGALVDLLWIRVICIVPCRLLRHVALGHWCGRALRVHFSLHCVCCVSTDEFDLAAVSSGRSQRVPFSMASSCTSCLFLWRCPFLLMRFVILPSGLRTCAQPLSVGVWHLEAARFVMGSVSARLNGTDVLVCRSTSCHRVYHESGGLFAEEVFCSARSPWQRQNGVQLFLLCVKFNRNCHRRHFDLFCGVCFFHHS